jgi:hypothetical protein
MKVQDFVQFFNSVRDPEFPSSGHSVVDSDVCVALIGCAECPEGQCCRHSGGCPRVFEVCRSVRDNLTID